MTGDDGTDHDAFEDELRELLAQAVAGAHPSDDFGDRLSRAHAKSERSRLRNRLLTAAAALVAIAGSLGVAVASFGDDTTIVAYDPPSTSTTGTTEQTATASTAGGPPSTATSTTADLVPTAGGRLPVAVVDRLDLVPSEEWSSYADYPGLTIDWWPEFCGGQPSGSCAMAVAGVSVVVPVDGVPESLTIQPAIEYSEDFGGEGTPALEPVTIATSDETVTSGPDPLAPEFLRTQVVYLFPTVGEGYTTLRVTANYADHELEANRSASVTVPDFAGVLVGDAGTLARIAGLNFAFVDGEECAPDFVCDQDPLPGVGARPGDTVTLTRPPSSG